MISKVIAVFLILSLPILAFSKPTFIGVVGFVNREMTNESGEYIGSERDPCLFPLFVSGKAGWKSVENSFRTDPKFQPLPTPNWWLLSSGESKQALHLEHRKTGAKGNNPQIERNCLIEKTEKGAIDFLKKQNAQRLNPLAVSNKEVTDPERWTRAKPPQEVVTKAKKAFIKRFEFALKCEANEVDSSWGTIKKTAVKLKPDLIKVDPRSFRSKSDGYIIGLRVANKRCLTDPHIIHSYYQKHWFFVTQDLAREIDSGDRPLSIEPLEAGDFDGDGKTEWVFRQNSVNAGSIGSQFILFDNDLREVARSSVHLKAIEVDE